MGRKKGERGEKERGTDSTTKGLRVAAFLPGKNLLLASSMTSPKLMTERPVSWEDSIKSVVYQPTSKVSVVTQGLHCLGREEVATKSKKYRKVLVCKENQTNKDLQDSSISLSSPKAKFSAMSYTEPLRNRNSSDSNVPHRLLSFLVPFLPSSSVHCSTLLDIRTPPGYLYLPCEDSRKTV